MKNNFKPVILRFFGAGAFFLFLCVPVAVKAQGKNADLIIVITGNSKLSSKYSYSIYQGDTLKSITKIPAGETFTKEHTLRCGKYRIQIYKNDSVYHEFTEIILECGYELTYNINLEKKSSYETIVNAVPDNNITYTPYNNYYKYNYQYIHLGYGTRILEDASYAVKHQFRFGMGAFINLPIARHIAFGINPESVFEFMTPKSDTTFRSPSNYRHERYFYCNGKLGAYLRFSSFNLKQTHDGGFFIDIGANYHLPFLFRHTGFYSNHKDVTRFLHKYNDVSLTARMGTDAFSVYGSYRLFDYLKYDYPQAPLLTFGFQMIIYD